MIENLVYFLLLSNGLLLFFVIFLLLYVPKNQNHKVGQRSLSKETMPSNTSHSFLQKLSSRKLWVALGAFITTMGVTWGFDDITTEQLAGTCVAISGLITYIGAEGYADGRSPTNKTDVILNNQEENQ